MYNDPDLIKHEIDAIQHRMKQRAEAIGDQLSPNRIVNETVSKIANDPRATLDQFVSTMKNHPVASAMAAAGIMAIAGASSRDSVARAYQNSDARRKANEGVSAAKRKARTVAKSSAERVNSLSENISDAETRIRESARDAMSTANDLRHDSIHKTRDLASDTKRFAEENPVALGLFAVGIGALAASVFTARRSDEPLENLPSKSSTKPKVSQAKKATKAKSQPNKTVKKMQPVKRSAASTKSASAPGKSGKVSEKAPMPTTRGAAGETKRVATKTTTTTASRKNEDPAVLADINKPRTK